MEKKQYARPQACVVNISTEGSLLESFSISDKPTETQFSRQNSKEWDDEDDDLF